MSSGTETVAFQAETKELLHLVIHSLYTHKEIFLRELVSNASDALDKRRVEQLRDSSYAEGWEGGIRLEVERGEPRLLRVIDNGVGMTREELVENLGTIARSGTRGFLQKLREAREGEVPELIGQFGVGFYSSFMVAEEVRVVTRKLGEQSATRWSSRGDGTFTLEEAERDEVGTTVELVLLPADEEQGQRDWTQESILRDVVKRYSDFVAYPIRMEAAAKEGEEPELVTLNSRRPLWTRPKSEVTEEEYATFYRQIAHDWNEPLETIHFKAEGATEYAALLFLPKERPVTLFDPQASRSRVALYVRRVFIMADCEELVPLWLRFVPGVVDASDLPLNVSRETLQHNRQMGAIQKRLTRKVLDTLAEIARERPEDYRGFWKAFGPVLKEGVYYDDAHREELAKLCLFETSGGEEPTTLVDYVQRMPVKQKEIYVLLASSRAAAQRSPHREKLSAKGFEVLYLVDPVDEFVLQRLQEFEGKTLRQIDKGAVELDEEGEKEERAAKEKELESLLEGVRKELAERVEAVRFTSRLSASPACLVAGEHSLSPQLERMLRDSGQAVPEQKQVLELNAAHPLVQRMHALQQDQASFERFGKWCELLYGQAQVAEGEPLSDPERFTKLVGELMLGEA